MLATLALSLVAQPVALAYCARYYTTGQAKSGFRVYVCDQSGGARKQVSTSGRDASEVMWAGKDRLVWVEDAHGEKPTLWTATLTTKAKKLRDLAKDDVGERKWMTLAPGTAALISENGTIYVGADGKVSHGKPPEAPVKRWLPTFADNGEWEVTGSGGYTLQAHQSEDRSYVKAVNKSGFTNMWVSEEQRLAQLMTTLDGKTAYLLTFTHDSTTGSHFGLIRFEFATGKSALVFDDATNADFWPGRPTLAWTTPRELKPIGGKQLWTNHMWVKDSQADWSKRVVTGNVWVLDAAIRPGAAFSKPDYHRK